jgi:hypothetical protein
MMFLKLVPSFRASKKRWPVDHLIWSNDVLASGLLLFFQLGGMEKALLPPFPDQEKKIDKDKESDPRYNKKVESQETEAF